MTFRRFFSATGLFVALLLPTHIPAQSSNASIAGAVSDSSGGALSGADLTLKATDSAKVSKAISGADGLFSFPKLPQGNYELRVSAKGFKDFVQTGIALHLNDSVRVPISLQLGSSSQTIEVNANASPLNFENGEVKGTLTKREITSLPLQVAGGQRSAAQFVTLMPGVNTGSSPSSSATARFSGGQERSDEATLDGVTMEEGLLNQSGMTAIQADFPISPEAVGEISLLTSNYDVQYGASGAAVIVASTKEGTNEFHGGGDEFHRNSFFNARPFGALKHRVIWRTTTAAISAGRPRSRGFGPISTRPISSSTTNSIDRSAQPPSLF